jgi:PAS domain S-box-containing protein
VDGTTIIGGLVVTRDVTEARRTARLLDELHAVLRVTFDHSPIGMGLLTTTGRWVRANPVLQSLLGMDEARLVTGRLQDVTHPEDLAAEQALGAALLAGERDHYVLAKRLLDAAGRDVPVLATTTLLRGSNGEPHGLICQVTRQEG